MWPPPHRHRNRHKHKWILYFEWLEQSGEPPHPCLSSKKDHEFASPNAQNKTWPAQPTQPHDSLES